MTTEEVASLLTEVFRWQTEAATDEQRTSVRRWQNRDKFYQQVQRAAAQEVGVPEEAHAVMEDLITLAEPLPDEVTVWRGIRSVERTYGVPTQHLGTLIGATRQIARFLSTSVDRSIVENEFVEPATSPAILRVHAARGTHAVWIPPLGEKQHACQLELLFLPTALMRILKVDCSGNMPVLFVEVSDG